MRNLLLVTLCLIAGSANAAVLTWTLEDVLLDDGQTLTGSFDYDRDTNSTSNVSIFNSGSTTFEATEFVQSLEVTACSFTGCNFHDGTPEIGDLRLSLFWGINGQELTNSGGNLILSSTPFPVFTFCAFADCSAGVVGPPDIVRIVNGSISAVPIPAAFWLFGSGLIGVMGLKGLKRRE